MEMLYCGFNGFGQLPTATSNIVPHLTKHPLAGIKDASLSWSHVAALSGVQIYLYGFVGGQSYQMKELVIPEAQQPLKISTSQEHILVVVETGDCWKYCLRSATWQKVNHFTNVEREITSADEEDTGDNGIVNVCCGSTFSVALSKSGHAFIPPSPIYNPGMKVTDVACGNEHCLLLTESGQVFSWGTGSRGQLGHGELESEKILAQQVDMLAGIQVISVAAGGWHSAAVTYCGELYTWGWNNSGQLGFPTIEDLSEVKVKDAPKSTATHHGDTKRLKSDETQSTNIVTILHTPTSVEWLLSKDLNVRKVSCGSRHTIVLLEDNTVWGCGWNAYGQLGLSPEELQRTWKMTRLHLPDIGLKTVTGLECGSWSTAVFVT